MDIKFMLSDTRSRVYLLWAVLAPIGFWVTQYYQQQTVNIVWTVISVIGLGFMYRVMPLRVKQMRNIFLAWLIPIAAGMAVSAAVFYIDAESAATLMGHLGAFWLGVMAVAYAANGVVDRPMGWYAFAAVLNTVACVLCFEVVELTQVQFLIAAIVTAWSMLNLLLFRTDVLV